MYYPKSSSVQAGDGGPDEGPVAGRSIGLVTQQTTISFGRKRIKLFQRGPLGL